MSCGGDRDEKPTDNKKAECEKKKNTHAWNEDKQSCDPKPADTLSRADCNKDLTKKWDPQAKEGKGECKDLTKEECALLAEVTWDEANNKCVLKSGEKSAGKYTVTLVANLSSISTISHIKLDVVSKNMSASLVKNGDCVRLKESDFALLKISSYNTNNLVDALCDSTDVTPPSAVSDCAVGNYSVSIAGSRAQFKKGSESNANIDKCKKLEGNPGLLN